MVPVPALAVPLVEPVGPLVALVRAWAPVVLLVPVLPGRTRLVAVRARTPVARVACPVGLGLRARPVAVLASVDPVVPVLVAAVLVLVAVVLAAVAVVPVRVLVVAVVPASVPVVVLVPVVPVWGLVAVRAWVVSVEPPVPAALALVVPVAAVVLVPVRARERAAEVRKAKTTSSTRLPTTSSATRASSTRTCRGWPRRSSATGTTSGKCSKAQNG
ncbi:hypothetical protein [Saccharopolyspora tripterygii]